jgi:dipicolinate synthase subunit A
MQLKKIAVIGGDERFAVCADLFSQKNCECAVYGLEKSNMLSAATRSATIKDALSSCDAVILPLPVSKNNSEIFTPLSDLKITSDDISKYLGKKCIIFSGSDSSILKKGFDHNRIITYTDSKDFAILGSVPTAECAISLAVLHSRRTCSGSKYLVVGCGTVGKQLSLLASKMGATVFVSARKSEDFAWIEAQQLKALKTYQLSDCDKSFDVIFNTVPHTVIDKKVLENLSGSPIIIELASKPYGAGFKRKKEKPSPAFLFIFNLICYRDSVLHQQ